MRLLFSQSRVSSLGWTTSQRELQGREDSIIRTILLGRSLDGSPPGKYGSLSTSWRILSTTKLHSTNLLKLSCRRSDTPRISFINKTGSSTRKSKPYKYNLIVHYQRLQPGRRRRSQPTPLTWTHSPATIISILFLPLWSNLTVHFTRH